MSSLGFSDHKRVAQHGRKSVLSIKDALDGDQLDSPIIESTPLRRSSSQILDGSPISDDTQFGTSGFYQSTFNAVNVLIGVGILSLPFAFKTAGWIIGFSLLSLFMILTNYTARIVAKCLDYKSQEDVYPKITKIFDSFDDDDIGTLGSSSSTPSDNFSNQQSTLRRQIISKHNKENAQFFNPPSTRLMSYGDIGEAAFQAKGRIFISIVFTLELFAAGVALIILMADSLHSLFPSQNLIFLKIVSFVIVTPSLWLKQLKWLSYSSIIGIFTIVNLLIVIVIDGTTKKQSPGSIIDPAETNILPERWIKLPITFGLIMAGFAGHAVFPNIYREMRDPSQFHRVVNTSYLFTFTVYATMATLGYLMFGEGTLDEITKNLALIPDYNRYLNSLTIWLVVVNPMTKYALTLQPVATSIELWVMRSTREWTHPGANFSQTTGDPPIALRFGTMVFKIPFDLFRVILRSLISALVVLVAIVFPGFERIISLLGSLFSFIVSVIFPILCYLKLFGWKLTTTQKVVNLLILLVSFVFASLGTLWAFLPASVVGVLSREL